RIESLAADADFEEILSACGTKEGDTRVIDLARVGLFPGPRAADTVKDASMVIAVLVPLMDAFVYSPKPILLDVYGAAVQGAKDAAEALQRGVRAMVLAVLEYLFARENHGGLRVVEGKAVLFSSAVAATAAASPVAGVPATPAPAAAPAGTAATAASGPA
ncbi:unnamed protein product, partial [Ectocarpus fasciculatus]